MTTSNTHGVAVERVVVPGQFDEIMQRIDRIQLGRRDALLVELAAIEKDQKIYPTTKQLREWWHAKQRGE